MSGRITAASLAVACSFLATVSAIAQTNATAPSPSHCLFHKADDTFSGSCGPLFDGNPVFELNPSVPVTSGVWRSDIHPVSVWAGSMTLDAYKFPVALEVYDGKRGILRTAVGWFAVSDLSTSPDLAFTLDAAREIKPEALDRTIVERAAQILSSAQVWNRKDNRICPADAKVWSIYCAMEKATIEVSGAADHRRPAMEAVRVVIEDRSVGRNYQHRLMDYNNDPTTTLDDVRSAFKEALAGMDDPKWLTKHGFATASPF